MTSAIARSAALATAGILFLALLGCSDARKSSEFDQNSGKHGAGWLPAGHSAAMVTDRAATASRSSCAQCHGEDLNGGIAGISCTACHLGGSLTVHPADWQPISQAHKGYVNANSAVACADQYCHGANLDGVAQSGPSCSSCHLGGPAHIHPEAWSAIYRDHATYTSTTGTAGCANQACHGSDLSGVQNSGPSCTSCHIGDSTHSHPENWTHIYTDHGLIAKNNTAGCANQACHGTTLDGVQNSGPSCTACHANPFTQGSLTCETCHQNPPDGIAFPNTAGKHAKHRALANVTCSTCHTGAGGSTVNSLHYNGTADVIFLPTYNSRSAVAAYDPATRTCSNVSCHGGPRTQTQTQANQATPQSTNSTTPDWIAGAIDVNTQCTACHIYGTAEHNSYWSGQHRKHVYDRQILCSACHDTAKLISNHFTSLNTSTLENPASGTLRTELQYTSTAPKSCNPYAGGLTTGCHDQSAPPENW